MTKDKNNNEEKLGKSFNDAFSNINDGVNDAINSMNFSDISKKIQDGLDAAINVTLDMIGKKTVKVPVIPTKSSKVCAQKLPEKSKASGYKFLSILIGIMGVSIGLPLVFDGLDYFGFEEIIGGILTLLATSIFAPRFWNKAKFLNRIEKNYMRFLRELGHNTVIPIRDLASSVQQTEKETVNDLLYMMRNGYFHQARIVENDSLFILDIETFKLYKEQLKNMPKEEQKEEIADQDEKTRGIIQSASKYLDQIEASKSKIKDRDFLEKVILLKKTLENIIALVEKYPQNSYALDKFMDYYLPTTTKLIDSFIEFEAMETDNPKILNSMKEIDKSIATINEAYEKIQVELVSDRAMDIKTDIDTMNLLLNQEGLLEDDWSKE